MLEIDKFYEKRVQNKPMSQLAFLRREIEKEIEYLNECKKKRVRPNPRSEKKIEYNQVYLELVKAESILCMRQVADTMKQQQLAIQNT